MKFFKKHEKDTTSPISLESEYSSFMEEYLKITGNDNIFKPFTEKVQNKNHITKNTQKEVFALNTLVNGIKDKDLKCWIYQKIIDELIIYCFSK
ncbi:MAG: hypothetical protein SPI06_00630 [Terrisporobacter sp.]|uniref:hypothetical protein n=1 Tax=Terrisporobacter sp. TaxID=1965305 RepID=UPI002A90A40E|nr:hypothetical protein [Terrisporobacter sp.]MDY6151890.1 hypothetical protein [Terrisporobacter sp.]